MNNTLNKINKTNSIKYDGQTDIHTRGKLVETNLISKIANLMLIVQKNNHFTLA